VFSQPVLLALIDSGLARDDAYRVVQEAARAAWEQRRPLREVLEQDDRVSVPAKALDEAFSLDNALRNVGLVFDALEDVKT
jgi:adenylosuccinate lyase